MSSCNQPFRKGRAAGLVAVVLFGLLFRETNAFVRPTHEIASLPSLSDPRDVYKKSQGSYIDPTVLFSTKRTEMLPALDSFMNAKQPEEVSSSLAATVQTRQENTDDHTLATMMALIFIVGSLSSLDRVAMSVALVPMTEEMGYTDSIKGSISSLFSVGYGIGILPSGLLIASLSPRWVMTAGIAIWSLGTIATPWAVSQPTMLFLLASRALVGASESVVIPTVQRLLSNWIPPEKKSMAVATVFAGLQSGTILAYSLSPILIDQFDDWRCIFYIYGGAGLLFLCPWLLLARDSPISTDSSDNVDKVDESDISIGTALSGAKDVLISAPWRGFIASKGVWAMFLAHAANNWGLYNNLSWTPTFYSEQYGLNVRESALLLVVPSIVGAIAGLTSGALADHVIQNLENKSNEAITNIRKIFQGIGLFGPSVCLGFLSYTMPNDPAMAQLLLSMSVGLQSFNAAGYGAANQEKAGEKWTGLLYGITSLPSVVIGTFAVYLTGRILDHTDQDWSIVFALNAAVYFIGAAAFVALYDSKREFE